MNRAYFIGYTVGIVVGWATAFCFLKIKAALTEIFVNRAASRITPAIENGFVGVKLNQPLPIIPDAVPIRKGITYLTPPERINGGNDFLETSR